MGKVNATVDLPASQERVWELIADPSSYERWLTIHTKWKDGAPRASRRALRSPRW